MKKQFKLLTLLLTFSLVTSCDGLKANSESENSNSVIEESSQIKESESSVDSSTSALSPSISETLQEKTFTLTSENFNKFDGITLSNVIENTQYPDEFTINSSGYITSNNINGITKIVAHVYSTYDNMKMYDGNDATGKAITPEVVVAEDQKSAVYTYNFNNSNSFYYTNSSDSYRVHIYSIEITYTGECNVSEATIQTPTKDPLVVDNDAWTNNDINDYYSSLDLTLSGNDLLASLRSLNDKNRNKVVGYNGLWNYFDKTDYDPNDPSKYLAFYRGTSASKAEMNKEHVWPKSRGGNLVEGDLHMTRPTLTSDNSNRGNSFYVEGMVSSSSGWDPKAAGMNEQYRGQAARIIFYCVVASNQLDVVDSDNDATNNKTMGKLSDLLRWNLQYPVDDSELRRNNGAQEVQGNRNPFIDNPSFACSIFGSRSQGAKDACSITYDPYQPEEGGENSENTSVDPTPSPSDEPVVEPSDEKVITLTTSSLNVAKSYIDSSYSVSSYVFEYKTIGDYGSGIQMKKSSDGNAVSILYNKTAFATGIEKVVFNYNANKDMNENSIDKFTCSFGNSVDSMSYSSVVNLEIGTRQYSVIPDNDSYTYINIANTGSKALYWDSIVIYLS